MTLIPFLSGILVTGGEVVASTVAIGFELKAISETLSFLPETIKHSIDGAFEDLKNIWISGKKIL